MNINDPNCVDRKTWRTDWVIGVADPSPAMTYSPTVLVGMTYDEAEAMAYEMLREHRRTVTLTFGRHIYAHKPLLTLNLTSPPRDV